MSKLITLEIESLESVLKHLGNRPEFVHDQNRMLLNGVIKNLKKLQNNTAPAYDPAAVEELIALWRKMSVLHNEHRGNIPHFVAAYAELVVNGDNIIAKLQNNKPKTTMPQTAGELIDKSKEVLGA